mmetsp:Transcript_39742/g.85813  ORF Transcript_39742/g.85813 Transcript_39742/m.85813 type:complete len:221 (+) Transcript_39742:620-1282(+)
MTVDQTMFVSESYFGTAQKCAVPPDFPKNLKKGLTCELLLTASPSATALLPSNRECRIASDGGQGPTHLTTIQLVVAPVHLREGFLDEQNPHFVAVCSCELRAQTAGMNRYEVIDDNVHPLASRSPSDLVPQPKVVLPARIHMLGDDGLVKNLWPFCYTSQSCHQPAISKRPLQHIVSLNLPLEEVWTLPRRASNLGGSSPLCTSFVFFTACSVTNHLSQ